jgi:glycerol-3-phosphate cytidylyltransferase
LKKYKTVYTTGAFDPFHFGHLNILRKAKEIAEHVIVGVSTDELIKAAKNRDVFMPLEERMDVISELKCVDKVIPQIDKDKQRIIVEYNVDAIVVGSDWKGRYPLVSCDMVYIDYTENINSTIIRDGLNNIQKILTVFDYKNMLIKEYKNWYLLLRKEQVTIGSLVLIEKSFQTNYADISNESFVEFGEIVKEIEWMLKVLFSYDKINYLMLMMVDDEVHYHIIPRYAQDIDFNGIIFKDSGWSGLPDMANINELDRKGCLNMIDLFKSVLNEYN